MLTMICKGYRQGLRWRIKAATRKQPGPQRRTVKVSTQRTKVFLVRYLFGLLVICFFLLMNHDVDEMNFMLRLLLVLVLLLLLLPPKTETKIKPPNKKN